jgi:hypothetical protein
VITSSPLYQRLMKFPPLVRRFVIGLVFYLVWFFDMKYFAYTALGPWIAGITLVICFLGLGFLGDGVHLHSCSIRIPTYLPDLPTLI